MSRPRASLWRGRATDGALETPLLWVLGAVAVGFAPHAVHFPAWVSGLLTICAGYRLAAEHRRWHLPPAWCRWLLALLAFFGVLLMYRSINGIVPGTALLAVMAALKLLETHRRRDLFVLLFIALFLVMAALLRGQALWTLPYLAAGLLVIGAAWLIVARRGAPLPPRRTFALSGRVLVHALPLLLVFWVLFPRVPGPFWAVPKAQSAAVTGISDTISPGDISQLSESDAIAFRVRFAGATPPRSRLYWRGPVLRNFNGRSWTVGRIGQYPPAKSAIQPLASPVTYTVALDPTNQRWLFALDMPVEWDLSGARMLSSQQLVTWQPIEDRTSYTATSYLSYRVNGPDRAEVRRANLALPQGRNPEARAFAESLFEQSGGEAAGYVAAVLKHFRDEPFFYTLRPPPLGADSVDEFLFGTRRGFCEHYASSFAFLMRAAGIPARVVVGYLGGEPNNYGDYWMVRQSDAHAWTEVWLADQGWVRVDPTAEVSALRIEAGLDAALDEIGERRGSLLFNVRLMQNLELIWDTVNARWDEWVLGYGPETQRRFLQWLGMRDPSWQKMVTWLGALALLVLALLTWRLARRFRRADPDAALRIYRRTTEALAPGTAATVSPERLHAELTERYPDLAMQLRRFTDDYLSLRYAGEGSVEALRASAQSLSRAAAAAPATTAAHR